MDSTQRNLIRLLIRFKEKNNKDEVRERFYLAREIITYLPACFLRLNDRYKEVASRTVEFLWKYLCLKQQKKELNYVSRIIVDLPVYLSPLISGDYYRKAGDCISYIEKHSGCTGEEISRELGIARYIVDDIILWGIKTGLLSRESTGLEKRFVNRAG